MIPVSIVVVYDSQCKLWSQIRLTKDLYENFHEFPGGKIEIHENPRTCAHREVLEETKIKVELEKIKIFQTYETIIDEVSVRLFVHLYHDEKKLFPLSGYMNMDELNDGCVKIPHANKEIIRDLSVYFENMYV